GDQVLSMSIGGSRSHSRLGLLLEAGYRLTVLHPIRHASVHIDDDDVRSSRHGQKWRCGEGGEQHYAFFSSSFFAAIVVSSLVTSLMPFLNSLTLLPSERARSGRRWAPNRISTMTRISSSS